MSATIGPGTRLLCVKAPLHFSWVRADLRPSYVNVEVGRTYTCQEVVAYSEGVYCPDCQSTCGIDLKEIGFQARGHTRLIFCVCQFVPLEGNLPEEITRCLDVDPSAPEINFQRIKEPA